MSEEKHAGKLNALTLIVPAFNEQAILESTVHSLLRAMDEAGMPFEILIINDGSSDATGGIADKLAAEHPERVRARHQENQGIGGAFQHGIREARGDHLILWPADMPAEAADLQPYLSVMGQADVIVGCRRRREGYNPLMRFNAWLYPWLVRLLFGLKLRDVNWICMHRTDMLQGMVFSQKGIPMLTEILVWERDRGARFLEIEVEMKVRTSGRPSASRFKVMRRTLAGLLEFWNIWRRERGVSPAIKEERQQ